MRTCECVCVRVCICKFILNKWRTGIEILLWCPFHFFFFLKGTSKKSEVKILFLTFWKQSSFFFPEEHRYIYCNVANWNPSFFVLKINTVSWPLLVSPTLQEYDLVPLPDSALQPCFSLCCSALCYKKIIKD